MADVARAAKLIEPAFAVVQVAQAITGVGGPSAAEAIKVLDAAVKAFEAGLDGTVTVDQVVAELAALRTGLVSADLSADAALAARFRPDHPAAVGASEPYSCR